MEILSLPTRDESRLEERLERGELIVFEPCPFTLPVGDEHRFLLEQRLSGSYHKNISYNPNNDSLSGCSLKSAAQIDRLREQMRHFADQATAWLAKLLPGYAQDWQRDRVSFRTEEEAIRKLRQTARNDLLHLDAFPSRPTQGYRILRLFVNINPIDERVWVTSDTFGRLLERFGSRVGFTQGNDVESWTRRLGQSLLRFVQPGISERSEYDHFMLRLHHFLKTNDEFQDRAAKRYWHFKPGTAWLAFTDTLSHAELRGQFALEHSFFIAPQSLALPAESPPELFARALPQPKLPHAA